MRSCEMGCCSMVPTGVVRLCEVPLCPVAVAL